MSPDLERRLRDGGKALAGPAAPVTQRAREAALAAVSGRRGGGGRVLAIGGTVLAAVAVGVVIGSFAFAERGTASEAPGLGFLPAEGWTVLQSGTPATPDRPGVALAANVPLHPQDTVDGFPYSTLRSLPRTAWCSSRASRASAARRQLLSRCPCRSAKPCPISGTGAR